VRWLPSSRGDGASGQQQQQQQLRLNVVLAAGRPMYCVYRLPEIVSDEAQLQQHCESILTPHAQHAIHVLNSRLML